MTASSSAPVRRPWRSPRPAGRRVVVAVGLALVMTVTAAGIAAARIPSSTDGRFSACVKGDGALRMIDHEAGARCVAGETYIAWSAGLRYRGTWSSRATYAVNDVVVRTGTSYLAKAPSNNTVPGTSATAWGLLAQRGAAGARGSDGNTLLNGTGAPTTVGRPGDFYLDTASQTMYGPKGAEGWGAGTPLGGRPSAAARVDSGGSSDSRAARNVAGAQRYSTGAYCVDIDPEVVLRNTVTVVTVEGTVPAIAVATGGICGSNSVRVLITNLQGSPMNAAFSLLVS